MSLNLHHIGEPLVKALLGRASKNGQLDQLPCEQEGCMSTYQSVTKSAGLSDEISFHHEVSLAPMGDRIFDGSHGIDCLAADANPGQQASGHVVAAEIKLGETGLGKSTVNNWLIRCNWSKHPTPRISGSMMAFLEARRPPPETDQPETDQPDVSAEPLRTAETSEVGLRNVYTQWWLIARHVTISSWFKSAETRPDFSENVHLLSIERLIQVAIGKDAAGEKLDKFVRQELMLTGNFFQRWKLSPIA